MIDWRTIPTTKLAGLGLSAILIGALVIGFMVKSCAREPGPKIPPKVQQSIDSLKITKPTFDSVARAGAATVARDTTRAKGYKTQATRTEITARGETVLADSLALVATRARSADSAALSWQSAYEARTREADAWHATAVRNDSAYLAERDARTQLAALYGADTLRRIATETVNTDLQKAIAKLQVPCRIIGPIPCPSRTATFVGSVVLGAVAARAIGGKP